MRRFTAFLCVPVAACLIAGAAFTHAEDNDSVEVASDDAGQPDDGDDAKPEEEKKPRKDKKRRDRGDRDRGRRGPGGREGFGRGREEFGRGREGFGRGREEFGRGREEFGRGREEFGRGPEGHGGPGGPPPVIAALDIDKDGEISSSEIEGAAAALRSLDENEDGKLTREELHPRPSHGHRGPQGPGGEEFGRRGFGPPREGRGGREGRGNRDGRGGPPSPEEFIERMMESDEDGDGEITQDEASGRLARGFDRVDADGNGSITRDEVEAMAKRFGERGRRGKGRPDDGRRKPKNRDKLTEPESEPAEDAVPEPEA